MLRLDAIALLNLALFLNDTSFEPKMLTDQTCGNLERFVTTQQRFVFEAYKAYKHLDLDTADIMCLPLCLLKCMTVLRDIDSRPERWAVQTRSTRFRKVS